MTSEQIAVAGTLASIAGVVLAYVAFVAPRIKRATQAREKRREMERAMRDVLLGRERGEANPITGEAGTERLPGIAERLNLVATSQLQQYKKLNEIHAELQAAAEKRFKDLEHTVKVLQHEISNLHKIIAVKAEAEKDLFPAMLNFTRMENDDESS